MAWPFDARKLAEHLGNPMAGTTEAVKQGNLLGLPGAALSDVGGLARRVLAPVGQAVEGVVNDPNVGPLLQRVAGAYAAGREGDPSAATRYHLYNQQLREAQAEMKRREMLTQELSEALPNFNPSDMQQMETALGILSKYEPEAAMKFAAQMAGQGGTPTVVMEGGQRVYRPARETYGAEAPQPASLVNIQTDPLKQGKAAVYDAVLTETGDESLAGRAASGKAYKDPISDIWVPGSDVDRRKASDFMGIVHGVIAFESALDELSEFVDDTSRWEDIKERGTRMVTGSGSTAFELYESKVGNLASLLRGAVESGVMTEPDIKRFLARIPSFAEAVRGGAVSEIARKKMQSLWRDDLIPSYVSRFQRADQARAGGAFLEYRESRAAHTRQLRQADQLADQFVEQYGREPTAEELDALLQGR